MDIITYLHQLFNIGFYQFLRNFRKLNAFQQTSLRQA